mmetsp:Transcript_16519/g.44734  ORF Transcript_16519/g.44734 Transcript_16519/m.44734 type:complete len:216 (-) Transcript_16519:354-1001(-)
MDHALMRARSAFHAKRIPSSGFAPSAPSIHAGAWMVSLISNIDSRQRTAKPPWLHQEGSWWDSSRTGPSTTCVISDEDADISAVCEGLWQSTMSSFPDTRGSSCSSEGRYVAARKSLYKTSPTALPIVLKRVSVSKESTFRCNARLSDVMAPVSSSQSWKKCLLTLSRSSESIEAPVNTARIRSWRLATERRRRACKMLVSMRTLASSCTENQGC